MRIRWMLLAHIDTVGVVRNGSLELILQQNSHGYIWIAKVCRSALDLTLNYRVQGVARVSCTKFDVKIYVPKPFHVVPK